LIFPIILHTVLEGAMADPDTRLGHIMWRIQIFI